MKMTKPNQNEKIIDHALGKVPSIQKILEEALKSIDPKKLEPKYIKEHLSESIVELEGMAFKIYLKYQEEAAGSMVNSWINRNWNLLNGLSKKLDSRAFVRKCCELFYPIAGKFEFRAGNMRKARAGKTFELITETLLHKIGCKCEKPRKKARKILKRIDLVVPNQKLALKKPDQAFFLSCKRTLRERWKQTIPERKPSWRVFLLTIDGELPEDKAKEIDKLGIIAYVKDDLKSKKHLVNKTWIRKLSNLPKDLGVS